MRPEYLRELADMVDDEELWRLSPFDTPKLPPEKRRKLDAGVALRRYASHLKDVEVAYARGKSVVTTKIAGNTYAVCEIEPPPNHQRSIDARAGLTQKGGSA